MRAGDSAICSRTDPISLLAHNEWCGLVALPEILVAFILPNDAALMTILNPGSRVAAGAYRSFDVQGCDCKVIPLAAVRATA